MGYGRQDKEVRVMGGTTGNDRDAERACSMRVWVSGGGGALRVGQGSTGQHTAQALAKRWRGHWSAAFVPQTQEQLLTQLPPSPPRSSTQRPHRSPRTDLPWPPPAPAAA